jgi:hypothetical protein
MSGDTIMKKLLSFLLAGSLLATAAWFVHVPNPAQADEIPEKYRDTVHKGLEYLAKHQVKDGHWEGDEGKHPVAMTGLVGLALLLDGGTEGRDGRQQMIVPERKYSAHIRKAVDWLMAKSQIGRDGLIFSEHASESARYMEGHGLAVLFLAGASRDERDRARQERLTDVLTRAVKYISKAQSTQGGWYLTSKVEGHDFDAILPTVIQIQALQAAENAGIPVPRTTINDAQEYLKVALRKLEEEAKPGQKRIRLTDTAAALACCFSQSSMEINGKRGVAEVKDELLNKCIKDCQTEIPMGREVKFGRDELTHYYYAQAANNLGESWTGYRTAIFDHLQSTQNKDGSWPAGDGICVGPVYATALWCTVLQLDRRNHPSIPPVRSIIITWRNRGVIESRPGLRLVTKSSFEPAA